MVILLLATTVVLVYIQYIEVDLEYRSSRLWFEIGYVVNQHKLLLSFGFYMPLSSPCA